MALMLKPAEASHACRVKFVRLKGSPEAKLRNRTAVMRLSPSACSRVGFFVTMRMARDSIRAHDPGISKRLHRIVHTARGSAIRQLYAEIGPRESVLFQRRTVQHRRSHRRGGTRLRGGGARGARGPRLAVCIQPQGNQGPR